MCVRACVVLLHTVSSLAFSASTEGTRQYLQEAVDLALASHRSEEGGRDQKEAPGVAEVSCIHRVHCGAVGVWGDCC